MTKGKSLEQKTSVWASITVLAFAALVLIVQMFCVDVLPLANSIRWFGDESWLMSEAISQITTGIVRYPEALGSTLYQGKGLVLGMTWISAVLYGGPAALLGSDPVIVGRWVSTVIGVATATLLYASSRTLGASRIWASVVTLFLVTSRAYLYATHSCRTDILAGMIVLAAYSYVVWDIRQGREHSLRWWLGAGASLAFLSFSSSIHLLTLLAPLYLYWMMVGTSCRKDVWIGSAVGIAITLGVMVGIYFLTTHDLRLFIHGAGRVQFHDVISSIPALRPFSRSVQIANLLIRLKLFWSEAPISFLLIALILLFLVRIRIILRSHGVRLGIILFLSWLLLEGAEINYLIHILPVMFCATAVLASRIVLDRKVETFVIPACCLSLALGAVGGVGIQSENGRKLTQANRDVADSIVRRIAPGTHPLIVTETPTLASLLHYSQVRIMTDHFLSFQAVDETPEMLFRRLGVSYVALYNSPAYPKVRPVVDSFYRSVASSGEKVGEWVGTFGDIGRDYSEPLAFRDTVMLYRVGGR